jgi:uncharacterized membrane protein YvbJ
MFWLKCCPRCGGDLNEDSDQYGHYIACVQCGHYLTEAEEVVLKYGPKTPLSRIKVVSRQAVGAGR